MCVCFNKYNHTATPFVLNAYSLVSINIKKIIEDRMNSIIFCEFVQIVYCMYKAFMGSIDEGRGQCECQSSQEATKIVRTVYT